MICPESVLLYSFAFFPRLLSRSQKKPVITPCSLTQPTKTVLLGPYSYSWGGYMSIWKLLFTFLLIQSVGIAKPLTPEQADVQQVPALGAPDGVW